MSDAGSSLSAGEADLYDVVPERFIAARDELARRLRSEGDKAAATRVGKLRRPPLTTWALNQVARIDPRLIEEMLAAGAGLRAAMERALDGDASGLRQAHGQDRAAMEAVVAAAVDRLVAGEYNVTDAIRQRMAATLRAATVDASVAADLTAGVLAGDRDAPGFGIDALSVPPAPAPAKVSAKAPAGESPAPEARPAAAPAGSADDDAAARRREAERLAEEANRRVEEAEERRKEAETLAAEADRLESEARHAEQRASQARERATQAQRQAAAAAAAAAEAKRQADAAAEPD